MRCSRCGSEFFEGSNCPNCGQHVMSMNEPTGPNGQEVSVSVGEMPTGGANSYSGGQEMPGGANPYSGGSQMTGGSPYTGNPGYTNGNPGYANGNQGYVNGNQGYTNGNPGQGYGQNGYNNQYGYNPYQNNQNQIPPEPQNNNSKTPFIIAGIVLGVAVIAIVIILLVTLGGKNKKDDSSTDDAAVSSSTDTEQTEEITTEAASEDETTPSIEDEDESSSGSNLDGIILYDGEEVAIAISDMEMDNGTFYAYGTIENKLNQDVYYDADAFAISGITVDGSMYTDIDAGGTSEFTISIYDDYLEQAGITHIDDLLVYFGVNDSSTYDTLCSDSFTLSCDLDTGVTPLYDEKDFTVIYEDDNVVLKAAPYITYEDGYDENYISMLYVENKMDVLTSVMLTDTFINGTEVSEHGGWEDIAPNTGVYADVYWSAEDISDAELSFEDITLLFDFFDYVSWDDYVKQNVEYSTSGVK